MDIDNRFLAFLLIFVILVFLSWGVSEVENYKYKKVQEMIEEFPELRHVVFEVMEDVHLTNFDYWRIENEYYSLLNAESRQEVWDDAREFFTKPKSE